MALLKVVNHMTNKLLRDDGIFFKARTVITGFYNDPFDIK
jgi:hypothetical protein